MLQYFISGQMDNNQGVLPKDFEDKKGVRTLRKTFKGELAFDMQILEMKLEKLADGLADVVSDDVDSEAQYSDESKEGNQHNE